MKRSLKTISLTLTAFFWLTNQAQAIPVTINFTADNITAGGGLCSDMACLTGDTWSSLGAANLNDWFNADSIVINLAPGTYYFAWGVANDGPGSSSNPAGLLAELLWQGNTNSSSAAWEVNIDWGNPSTWTGATSYGYNGETGIIWTNVNGGPVAGIGSDAEWIWTDSNFGSGTDETGMDQAAWFRTSITVTSVPEPSTLALLGLGLLGLGLCRRWKA